MHNRNKNVQNSNNFSDSELLFLYTTLTLARYLKVVFTRLKSI